MEERSTQLEVFAKTAEAKSKAGKAKTKARGERDTDRKTVPRPLVPLFANTSEGEWTRGDGECVCGIG